MIAIVFMTCILACFGYKREFTNPVVDQAFKDAAIQAHNKARFSVDPPATNMHVAVWNDDLARTAQQYSTECNFNHNRNMLKNTKNIIWSPATVGENIYKARYDMSAVEHMKLAVKLWDEERQNYNYATRFCSASNPGCGHYTQAVWHNSANVGCGIHFCNDVEGWTYIICNYGPGGNINIETNPPYSTSRSETPCTVNPCLHDGKCTPGNKINSYSCSCPSKYSGVNCQIPTVCANQPCKNGGTCKGISDDTDYMCTCVEGYGGKSCENNLPCETNPCKNNGQCSQIGTSAKFTCSCRKGTFGNLCEKQIVENEYKCGFEDDMCGFTQADKEYRWYRRMGMTPTYNTGPDKASEGRIYLYVEASRIDKSQGNNAMVTSDAVFGDGTRCVTFDYHMYGRYVKTLEVYAGKTKIWSKTGDQGNRWLSTEIQTDSLKMEKLSFNAIYGGHFFGDIAIDNIVVTPGTCKSPCAVSPCQNGGTCEKSSDSTYKCTCADGFTGENCATESSTMKELKASFTNDLSGFVQLESDDFDWIRQSGKTSHIQYYNGNYVFIDGSNLEKGSKAILETKRTFEGGPFCLSVFFNTYDDFGRIVIGTKSETFNEINFSSDGNWYRYAVNLSAERLRNKKLRVTGVVSGKKGSSMALDDLNVKQGSC